jgi:F like protein
MNRESWRPTRRTETEYLSDILRIISGYFKREPVSLLSASEFIEKYALQAAMKMITGLYFHGARTWREAAMESSMGRLIAASLQQEMRGPVGITVRSLIAENATLIKTLPQDIAFQVSKRAAKYAQVGGRHEDIARVLTARIGRVSAHRLARTEVSKANTALIEARAENLNLPAYVWETSQDERVRFSHRKMQGVLVFWNDPPSPEALVGEKSEGHYQAGGIWNCRCTPASVVRLEHLDWPRKVYRHGAIRQMTLTQVRRLYERVAA